MANIISHAPRKLKNGNNPQRFSISKMGYYKSDAKDGEKGEQ